MATHTINTYCIVYLQIQDSKLSVATKQQGRRVNVSVMQVGGSTKW